MTKLTELEKQKTIACVGYIEAKFRCDRYKIEIASNKLGYYDEELDKQLEYAKEMENFYSKLSRKLKEVL